MNVPKVLPGLVVFPKENLAFDQAAITVKAFDQAHVFGAERFADRGGEIAQYVLWICRKGNGNLATLDCPLNTHCSKMHAKPRGDLANRGIFGR